MWGENHVDFYLGGVNLPSQPAYSVTITPCLASAGMGVDLGDINGDHHDDVLVSDGGTFNTATVYSLNPVGNDDPVAPGVSGDLFIVLSPNPISRAGQALNIDLKGSAQTVGDPVVVEIFNIKGQSVLKEVYQNQIGAKTLQVAAFSLSNGIYFCRVTTGKHTAITKFSVVR